MSQQPPRVLILGGTGMLGGMLWQRLSIIPDWRVRRSQRRDRRASCYFDALSKKGNLSGLIEGDGGADFVINALGLTKPEIDEHSRTSVSAAKAINAELPHLLADAAAQAGARLIHVSTDGVFSGAAGPYDEFAEPDPSDVYGSTKLEGEVAGPRALTIRCSIIGPEREKGRGLFEWFRRLKPGSKAKGYSDQLWNGVTTTQFADLCRAIIEEGSFDGITAAAGVRHFCPNEAVSKCELLKIFKKATGSDVDIEAVKSGAKINRVLESRWTDLNQRVGSGDLAAAVAEMIRVDDSLTVNS